MRSKAPRPWHLLLSLTLQANLPFLAVGLHDEAGQQAAGLHNDAASCGSDSVGAFDRGALRFRADGTFKILQLTDLHYGESVAQDAQTDEVQRTLLAAEQPDLVVLSGDMVSGWQCAPGAPLHAGCWPGWFAERWAQLIAPVHAARVPYAVILGNHDAEAELSRRQVIDLDIRTGGLFSLTQQGPPEASGAGNYWLDVLPAGAGAGQPAARIWLLDSQDRTCPPALFGWGCVADDTVAWVNRTAAGLPPAPSLAFVHIPLPQFIPAWWDGPTVGRRREPVCCPARDSGLFAAARHAGLRAFYSGHDHNNDYVGEVDGVRLAFGRKTGYGSYGPPPGWGKGARVVELRLGQDTAHSATWLRLEDGSKLVQQGSARSKGVRQPACHSDDAARQDAEAAPQQRVGPGDGFKM